VKEHFRRSGCNPLWLPLSTCQLNLKALLLLVHFLDRDFEAPALLHEVALRGLLRGQALAEQFTLPIHLADDHEGYDEGWEEAEAEGEEELGHIEVRSWKLEDREET